MTSRLDHSAHSSGVGEDDAGSHSSSSSTTTLNKKLPHYAAPTQAVQLPEYANTEAEMIRASFSTGNYRMISHLPTELRAHHVSEATANRIDDNITSAYFVAPHGSYRKFGGKDSLFSTFDYAPEEYSLASKLLTQERKTKEDKRLKVNPLPFLYSTPRPLVHNQLAGLPSFDANAQFSGLDPYESSEEHQRRQAYLESQKILHGPFVPSHGSRSIGDDKVIRMKLPDIIAKLMAELDQDWGDTSFQIYCDEEDLIIIQWDLATIDNQKGLLAYMNMFVKTNSQSTRLQFALGLIWSHIMCLYIHLYSLFGFFLFSSFSPLLSEVISEYALSKLVELWNHIGSDGFLYYSFKPPWVRRRIEESLFVLHPEMAKGGKYIASKPHQASIEQGDSRPMEQPRLMSATAANAASAAQSHQHPLLASSTSSHPPSTIGHSSHKVSPEDRAQMSQLIATFDAGLSVRRDGPTTNGPN